MAIRPRAVWKIRDKNLHAINANDKLLRHQYCFEEICAKTLFNMSGHAIRGKEPPFRFDDDVQFWVFPIAVQLAHVLKVEDPLSISSELRPIFGK